MKELEDTEEYYIFLNINEDLFAPFIL